MRLKDILNLLQNALINNECLDATYRIGINIDKLDEYDLEYGVKSVCKYEYHIYLKFESGVFSKVRVVHIRNLCDRYYSSDYLFFDLDKVICNVSSADGIISSAKELDVIQIDDIDEDIKNEFNKMLRRFNELKKPKKNDLDILDELNDAY